jgi:hypothetical protein
MTQPPGPYGTPYGQPTPPYGQPGPIPYGPPPTPGTPPYGPPAPQGQPPTRPYVPQGQPPLQGGPYGPPPQPPQPPRKNLLPWLIVGGALLLAGIGIALVLLFTGGDSEPARDVEAADTTTTTSESASPSSAEPTPEEDDAALPGGAQVAEEPVSVGGAFAGSDAVAFSWVDALADGNWQTAYDLSCAEVRDASTVAAAGGDPAYELGRFFYTQTLGGVGFTGGTFDSITHDPTTNTDMAVFTLAMEDGTSFTLLVYVQPDLTVCDFL